MIEEMVVSYLSGQGIASGGVFAEVPVHPPDEYVTVEKTGGGMRNGVRRAMVAVRCATKESMHRAAEMNELAIAAMLSMPDHSGIFGCYLNSDYNFTDAAKGGYRYQAVFNIYY